MSHNHSTHKLLLALYISACASSVAHAQNLITNGDFTAGNTGFSSGYSFVTTNIAVSEYGVVTDPKNWNPSLFSFADHTNNATGSRNMLVANGSTTPDVTIWSQTVAVTPSRNYLFSGWISSAYNVNAPAIEFFAGTVSPGTINPIIITPGTWAFFSGNWNSGSSTSVSLRMRDNNLESNGNDVAVDDLSFTATAVPESGTLPFILLTALIPLAKYSRRRMS